MAILEAYGRRGMGFASKFGAKRLYDYLTTNQELMQYDQILDYSDFGNFTVKHGYLLQLSFDTKDPATIIKRLKARMGITWSCFLIDGKEFIEGVG